MIKMFRMIYVKEYKIETDNHSSNNIKTAEVDKMIKEGFSDDEIAEK